MTAWQNTNGRSHTKKLGLLLVVLLLVMGASSVQLYAQATQAGTQIGNTAIVNYTDPNTNTTHQATSQPVYTWVQQVDSFSITPTSYPLTAVPNENVSIKYTITNNSNGDGYVQLSFTAPGTPLLTNVHLYPDSSNAPNTAATPLETAGTLLNIPYGQTKSFWLTGTAVSTAGGPFDYTITATDVPTAVSRPTGVSASNWSTPVAAAPVSSILSVTISSGASVNVTKGFYNWPAANTPSGSTQVTSGAGNAPLTMRFSYANTGLRTATEVNIVDAFPAGGPFTLDTATQALWNGVSVSIGTLASPTTATQGGQTLTLYYDSTARILKAKIVGVPVQGGSGVTYNLAVKVNVSTTNAGTYTNTARFNFADSVNWSPASTNSTTCETSPASCTPTSATYQVVQSYLASLTTATRVASPVYGATATYASVTAAAPIYFLERATNGGNGSDNLTLSITNNTFPSGTQFKYYTWTGGATIGAPMTPSNGAPTGSDTATYTTGSLAAGQAFDYVVEVILPANAYVPAGASFRAVATPTNSGTGAQVTDSVTTIVLPLDLTSALTNGSSVAGVGPGPTGTVDVTSAGVNPGSAYTFTVTVANNTASSDTYRIVASNSNSFDAVDNLPSGWTVQYFNSTAGNCSTVGSAVTFPVTIAANAAGTYCAQVTIPTGTAANATGYPAYFQAQSTTVASVKDGVYDALVVNTFLQLTVSTHNGTVNPGSAVVYTNTITNTGNAPISSIQLLTGYLSEVKNPSSALISATAYAAYDGSVVSSPITLSGGSYAVYYNGAPISASNPLPINASAQIYIQVGAGAGAIAGNQNIATLTVGYNCSGATCAATAQGVDTTVVVSAIANVTVTKYQAVDANCNLNGGSLGGITFTTSDVKATPGACIIYRIVAQNNTGQAISNVYVTDNISSYTKYCDTTAQNCVPYNPAGAAVYSTSNLGWVTLPAGASEVSGTASYPSTATNGGVLRSTTINSLPSTEQAVYVFAVKIQ